MLSEKPPPFMYWGRSTRSAAGPCLPLPEASNVGVEAGDGGERPPQRLVEELLNARGELAAGHVDQGALYGSYGDSIGKLNFSRCPRLYVVSNNLLRSELAQGGDLNGLAQ